MKFLVKLFIGIWLGIGVLGGCEAASGDDGDGNNNGTGKQCMSSKNIVTSLNYGTGQTLYCYCVKKGGGYSCSPANDKKTCETNCSQVWVYDDNISKKKGLTLIQYFLSTILTRVVKFGSILAVLAIVFGGIQISMQGDGEGGSVGKDKIIGGIAALIVLFFAGVILNFIDPNYYVWS